MVWPETGTRDAESNVLRGQLRSVAGVLDDLPPLSARWLRLIAFVAHYYQRSLGEVAMAALPPGLRAASLEQLARRLKRLRKALTLSANPSSPSPAANPAPRPLTDEQSLALHGIETQPGPFLLFGSTGSGKTEVYLRAVQQTLDADAAAQALVMVPEINLTPQLEARFRAHFEPLYGEQALATLHSGMTPAQRTNAWLGAHLGQARIVLGTRMAVLASIPHLKLVVVDEEHDPSYKQQEGARYSARDLAVYRAQVEVAKVVLGSATPSLESWHQSRPAGEGGRYLRLHMPTRVGAVGSTDLPRIRLIDMAPLPRQTVLAAAALESIAASVARGEQALVLLNRRGYAPVLQCSDCEWKSECPHCSAYRVFHKKDRTLRCHHCGYCARVPSHCPSCGNADIAAIGQGTERLEEHLHELFSALRRPGGEPVRILRLDADTTRHAGSLETGLAQVHEGEVDILVGTQMVAKGHDFRRVSTVVAVNPDGALFSNDFRAPERLFALLMQTAGRAGRDPGLQLASGHSAQVWIQTRHPQHALYQALTRHDYAAFAAAQLKERQGAGLPPWSFQALLRADGRTQEQAQAFLNEANAAAHAAGLVDPEFITLYSAVPLPVQRVANVERAQMLIESSSRAALQRFLGAWHELLHSERLAPAHRQVIRWAIDVDPQSI